MVSGYLSYDDFVSGIKRLNIDEEELGFALTDAHLYRVSATLPASQLNEFIRVFLL